MLGPHRRPVAPARLSWSLEQPGTIPGMVTRVTATAGAQRKDPGGTKLLQIWLQKSPLHTQGAWRRCRDHNCVTAQGFLCSESPSGSTSSSCSYCCTTQLLLFPGSLPQETWDEETSLTQFALWEHIPGRVRLFWQQLTITPLHNGGKQCNKAVKWLPKTTENAGSWAEPRFPVPSMLCRTEITVLPSNRELFNLTNNAEEQKHIHMEPGKYHCFSLVLQKSS